MFNKWIKLVFAQHWIEVFLVRLSIRQNLIRFQTVLVTTYLFSYETGDAANIQISLMKFWYKMGFSCPSRSTI